MNNFLLITGMIITCELRDIHEELYHPDNNKDYVFIDKGFINNIPFVNMIINDNHIIAKWTTSE